MISVTDAARFAEESIGTRKFKPWWEMIMDYFILGLLLLTLFSWAKVISAEASGLLCIPLDPKIGYSFNLAKYFNSRCAQVFENKLLLYYPYFLFALWLVLSLVQKLWLKLPAVRCRFESFDKMFTEMIKMRSKVKYQQITSPERFSEFEKMNQSMMGNHEEELLHLVVKDTRQRMFTLVNKKSFLFQVYIAKNITLLVILASTLSFLTYWTSKLVLFKANFYCHLNVRLTFTPVHAFTCNFTSVQFLYVIILISMVLQFLTLVFCLYAVYWTLSKRWKQEKIFLAPFLKSEGSTDLQICLGLFKCTVQEFQEIFKAMEMCLQNGSNTTLDSTEQKMHGRNEDFVAVKYITDHLGLAINPTNKNSIDSFAQCLQQVKAEAIGDKSMRNKLADEIRINVPGMGLDDNKEDSTYLLKTMSRIMNIKMVVVHCYSPYSYQEIFEPPCSSSDVKTHFITFCQPNFYHTTTTINSNATYSQRRLNYTHNVNYRKELRREALEIFKSKKSSKIATPQITRVVRRKSLVQMNESPVQSQMNDYDFGIKEEFRQGLLDGGTTTDANNTAGDVSEQFEMTGTHRHAKKNKLVLSEAITKNDEKPLIV